MKETKTKVDLSMLKQWDICVFANGETAETLQIDCFKNCGTDMVLITFNRPVRQMTGTGLTRNATVLYYLDGKVVNNDKRDDDIVDCLRGDGIDPPSIFTNTRHLQNDPNKEPKRIPVVVSKIKPGQWCGFDTHEQAIVKSISPSRLHKGCFDIRFDRMVTGYIDGRRGGERRNEWCYDADGKFANYKGKANNILFVWGITTVTLDGKPVDETVNNSDQTTIGIPNFGVQKVTDEQGNVKAYCVPNVDPIAILKPFETETHQNSTNVTENDFFDRLEYTYKTGTETPANILDKAVRLFALAAGKAKENNKVDELTPLCDADNDYDFWFPVKYKDEPWKPMRSMSGICTPYRFKSQESCMKAISKIGREGLNKIYGVK